MSLETISSLIRDVPDFPKPGILFKDITPVLRSPKALEATFDLMEAAALPWAPTIIAGPEARGFIFGIGLACRLNLGFVPIRKPGKLPWKTRSASYQLEYGEDRVEIHEDAVTRDDRVLLIDDLLATGGTMGACCELVEGLGAHVAGCLFLVELGFLDGRKRLGSRPVSSILQY